mgnify:CR=1 FL=1
MDLNLSECATLAGITQNPTKFNPIINPDSNRKRRKEVLQHMLDQNYITQDQYDEALADDVYSRIQAAQEKNSSTENTVYTYFEDELTDQIIKRPDEYQRLHQKTGNQSSLQRRT